MSDSRFPNHRPARVLAVCLAISALCLLAGCQQGQSGATAAAEVSDVQLEQSAVSGKIGTLTFDFTTGSGDSYRCVMTGLRHPDALTDEAAAGIAQDVAEHVAGGSAVKISGVDGFAPVDAEKYTLKYADAAAGDVYGDSCLCWAASAANMLVTAGWAADMAPGAEDEVLSLFTNEFYDSGYYQADGIKFYFDGVNEDQPAAETAGKDGCRNAIFAVASDGDDDGLFGSVMVRDPGTDKAGKAANVGQQTDFAAEAYVTRIAARTMDPADAGRTIAKALDRGAAVGLAGVFVDMGRNSRVGVHALTACGYVANSEGSIVALCLTDSDNDADLKKDYPATVEETLAARMASPDSVTVYPVSSLTFGENEFLDINEYVFPNKNLKYTDLTIQEIAILEPRTADCKPEAKGTRNAASTPDIVLLNAAKFDLDTAFSVKAGKQVKIPFGIKNASYAGFNPKDKPQVNCVFYIKSKNGSVVDTVDVPVPLVTKSYTTGEANCMFSVTGACTFAKPGRYTVDVEVRDIVSGVDGHSLKEAYTGNNYLAGAATVTVK